MIQQGRSYQHGNIRVIALTGGEGSVRVQVLDDRHQSGLGRIFNTWARYLSPLPQRYLGGAIPDAHEGCA
jgi:hypothetical protein